MNHVVLVGKLKEDPKVSENSSSYKKVTLVVSVRRNFRSSEGIYESDDFQVSLWRGMAEEIIHNAKCGDVVSIKGRFQANNYVKPESQQRYYNVEIIAEQIVILNNLIGSVQNTPDQ